MTIDATVYTPEMIIALIVLILTIIVIDHFSKKLGRAINKDIASISNALEISLKAIEDGEITDEEKKEIADAVLVAKENVKPYIDLISKSGIFTAIRKKIKGAV